MRRNIIEDRVRRLREVQTHIESDIEREGRTKALDLELRTVVSEIKRHSEILGTQGGPIQQTTCGAWADPDYAGLDEPTPAGYKAAFEAIQEAFGKQRGLTP